MADLLRCSGCGHVVGERLPGGVVVGRHRGRETGGEGRRVRCERCAAVTEFPGQPQRGGTRGGQAVEQR